MHGMQIVVMAGGANDFMLPALSLQEWSAPYLNFLQTVGSHCGTRAHKSFAACLALCSVSPLVSVMPSNMPAAIC